MADRETIRRAIESAYAARDGGDAKRLAAAFHADGLFALSGSTEVLPIAQTIRGQPDIEHAMAEFIGTFEFQKRDIISIITDGDRAAVHSRLKIRYTPKGKTITSEVVDLFKFQGDEIVELVEFADTALIKDLMA